MINKGTVRDAYEEIILTEEQKNNEFIRNSLYAEIFSGYEDMSVRPYGFLTRAEAATVFVRLDNYLKNNNL